MKAPHGAVEPLTLLAALQALKAGEFAVALCEGPGVDAATARAFDAIVAQLRESARREETQQWFASHLEQLVQALQRVNENLEARAASLTQHIAEIEARNREIESERRALEEKAEQMALASQYKTEFLASMSHELRTPLNSLLILAKLLADNARGTLSSKDVDYAKTIYAAGTDLLAIINDILDLAKIESGTSTLFYANEALDDIRDSIVRNFSQLAESRRLDFAVELDATLPPQIETDGKRLRQILKNLLSNAFKFTERGSVTLRIESAPGGWTVGHKDLDAAAAVIAFSVIDTGIGISESSQQLIFNAFQQVDGTTSRRYGGTGLGLSISRELAHLMKGEICVESVPGEGSRFSLYLPLRPATARPAPVAAGPRPPTAASWEAIDAIQTAGARQPSPQRPLEQGGSGGAAMLPAKAPAALQAIDTSEAGRGAVGEASGEGLAGHTVLIIDDDIRNIFALTCALEERQMNVCSAESGPEGIEILRSRPGIDAVLVDIMMPGVDGYETMRRIRAIEALREVPIVAVTAKAMQGDREKCLEAGASDYAAKPVNIEHLFALLRRLLVNGRVSAALRVADKAD